MPDVDLIFVGPSDLSQVLGVTGDFENPKCLEAIQSIAKATAAAGKPWGVFSRGPDYAARMKDWGCQLFCIAADLHVVHAGIRDVKSPLRRVLPAPGSSRRGKRRDGPRTRPERPTARMRRSPPRAAEMEPACCPGGYQGRSAFFFAASRNRSRRPLNSLK